MECVHVPVCVSLFAADCAINTHNNHTDSLTEGFYDEGQKMHPYTMKLHDLLATNHYEARVGAWGQV